MSSRKNLADYLYATKVLRILVYVLLFLTLAHLTLQFLNLNVYHQQNGQVYELSNRFDFDDEASVPTWFSQALFIFIGATAALAAYLQKKRSVRRMWGVVALLGLVLSIDEIAALHERFLQAVHVIFYQDASPGGLENAWLLVLPFVLFAGAWMTWIMARQLPRRTVLLFVISGGLFLVGAIGVDLSTSIVERENFLNQGIMVAAEESLELLGLISAFYTILDYLEKHHHLALRNALQQLRPDDENHNT